MADPKWAVQAPDGKVIQFPDSFTDVDVTREMTKMYPAQSSSAGPRSTGALPPQPSTLSDNPVANFAKNAYQGAKGAVTGAYDLGKDLVQNPNWFEGPNSTAQKFVYGPAEQMAGKAKQAYGQRRYSEAAGYGGAAALPFVGPWAASLGEQAGKGDISGAAGQLAGGLAVGKIAKTTGEVAADLPKNMVEFTRRATSLNEVTKAGAGVYQSQVQPAFQKLQGAIKAEGARTIQQAIQADKAATQGMPMKGTISTAPAIGEVAKAIEDTGHIPTPQTAGVMSRLNQNPMLSLEDAQHLRSDVGSAASKADRMGNAKMGKILWSAYDQLGEGMKGRIQELSGTTKPYEHYNNEFKAAFEMNKGIAGSMQDSIMDRHDSIPKLKELGDADLTEIKEQAAKYGMRPDEFDMAQKNAKSVAAAHDSLSGKMNKSLYRMMMGGGATGLQVALPLSVYAAAHGAGLYGLAPLILASYVGAKVKGLEPEMETGRILRKLNINPDSYQVRTPVEGPQNFTYPDQDALYNAPGAQSQPPTEANAPATKAEQIKRIRGPK
jgi:hypothetical protein